MPSVPDKLLDPPSISAFFPCYNDGGTIASMIALTDLTLRQLTDDYEILVIDDGSSDHARELLDELKLHYPQLRLVYHEKNRGYGGALRSGFANSTKELVFYTDGDMQYDPTELRDLLRALRPETDVVNGYKIQRHDPVHRILIGRIYHHLMKFAFGFGLRDVDCDFRLIRRRALERIHLEYDSGVICVEMIKKLTDLPARFAEVPVHHFHRAYGTSQFFNFKRLFTVAVNLFGLWWKLVVRKEHLQGPAGQPAASPRKP
ncbi:MAG: glycosyltransferase family 2 protein [Candidatus Wallbacteria bacterium]|nr:glycosyltransferase family 2 protein [Candidatus Wallbacteria bacterium]